MPMNTTSMPDCQPGAMGTRQSAALMVSMRATTMVTGSAKSTSTPSRALARCCASGCARTAASRGTNCCSVSVSFSSCTTSVAVARLCSGRSSAACSSEASYHPGSQQERPAWLFPRILGWPENSKRQLPSRSAASFSFRGGAQHARGVSPATCVLSRCHAACRTRARRRSKPARPYIVRFSIFSLLIWSSAGLVVQPEFAVHRHTVKFAAISVT
jgi:hypothetical protein